MLGYIGAVLLLLFVRNLGTTVSPSLLTTEEPEDVLKRIITNYTKHQRPRNETGERGPVAVEVNLFINSFSSVSVVDMDYSMDLLLRQRWTDARLKVPGNYKTLSISYLKDSVWIPDLFFRNAKHGLLHTITTPNYLLWLNQSGTITFSQKLTVKLSCPMDLWNFPMDTQHCRCEIGSYGYSMEDLQFRWWIDDSETDNVRISENLHLNEFVQPTFTTGYCNKKYKTTGAFTCIYVEFVLIRKFGFYLIYTYLPSMLIIVISWISFLIDYHAVPARISIGLLSILALMTESAATVQKLPRVSYVKAIDVWLFACLAFVVLSLLEFAVVNTISRRQAKYKLRQDLQMAVRNELVNMGRSTGLVTGIVSNCCTEDKPSDGGRPIPLHHSIHHHHNHTPGDESSPEHRPILRSGRSHSMAGRGEREARMSTYYAHKAQRLDRAFLVAFPVGFGVFNVIYWLYFCSFFHS